jgi:membrane-associated protein
MDSIQLLLDYLLHLDRYLGQIIDTYGFWTYGILFLVVFCETGLVVTPFLPGDSLLFATGALTATTPLELGWVMLVLGTAAVIGDTANYWVGYFLGDKLVKSKRRIIKKEHLDRTHEFFEKYGRKTIILARFVPLVRTFAPFVAGMGKMSYFIFTVYNVIGACIWVGLLVPLGRLFGNLPIVKEYFSLVVLAIIFISILPLAFECWKQFRKKQRTLAPA